MLQSAEQSGQGDADGQHLIATPWCEEHPGTRIEFVADGGWYEAIAGVVGAHAVMAGRRSWLESGWAQPVPADLAARAEEAEAAGQTTVYAGWDGLVRGVFAVSDTVKPTSAEAIARLRGMGLRPVLLTGDNTRAATAVAARVGIDEVIAQVLPAGKVDVVKRLQASGRVVAMVGDGVNDAAALAQADLALAMGTGADAAIEASDLTLVRGDLRAVPDAIRLSRRTLRTIKGNLFWAFAYNVAAIPLAAFGLLNPLISGAAMAFSSVSVVSNSLRLRRFRPAADHRAAHRLTVGPCRVRCEVISRVSCPTRGPRQAIPGPRGW